MNYFKKRDLSKILSEYTNTKESKFLNDFPAYSRSILMLVSGVDLAEDFRILQIDFASEQNYVLSNVDDNFTSCWILFAFSGQGDFWLLNKHINDVGFYDHNVENYNISNITSLNITLEDWIILGDLLHQFDVLNESNLDAFNKDYTLKTNYKENLVEQIESIRPGLFERFPFREL